MKINPKTVSWRPVTERTDGSPIPGAINYDIGEEIDGAVVHKAVIVGSLQDELYEAPLGDFAWDAGVHSIALRATEQDTGLVSTWSNIASFEIVTAAPKAPLAVAVG